MNAFSKRLKTLNPEEIGEKVKAIRDAKYQEYCEQNGVVPRAEPQPCQRCGSNRIAEVFADGKDYSDLEIGEEEANGYFPAGILGNSGGGELRFSYCLDCGQLQGEFPVSEEAVTKAMAYMRGEGEYEDEDE